ncbi:MAG: hypothetical protein ACLVJG_04230 [Coprococcus comes]
MQDTKKVAGELLVELEKKGVTFETVDGKLKYKDSKGNFTENSKEKVKKYKEEIIEILKKKQTIDERNKGITNQSRIQQRFVKYEI